MSRIPLNAWVYDEMVKVYGSDAVGLIFFRWSLVKSSAH